MYSKCEYTLSLCKPLTTVIHVLNKLKFNEKSLYTKKDTERRPIYVRPIYVLLNTFYDMYFDIVFIVIVVDTY